LILHHSIKKKEINELYKKLISPYFENKGFNFWKFTQRKDNYRVLNFKTPKSWRKIYFKLYPRLRQINLKGIITKENKLFSIIQKRKSTREFTGRCLSLDTISKILYFSSGIRNFGEINDNFDKSLRMYPSAGARYPLEVYPVILKSKEISVGIYHYNVKWNTLELLLKGDFRKKFGKITGQNWVENSAVIIIITAVFPRTIVKYKERGWRYIFFEVGHLTQNIQLIATMLRLKSCPIGDFIDQEIISLLDLNSKSELPLYLLAIGE